MMQSPFFSVLGLAQLILAMLAHECGHVVLARYHRVEIKKITFGLLGPCIHRERTAGWPEVSICLAGIAVNFALAVAFWRADYWFALCNFTFAWLNFLPLPHADGRHALEAWRELRREARFQKLMDRIAAHPEPGGR